MYFDDEEIGFGLRLKRLRLANHMTQKELAAKLGMSVSNIKAWERENCFPTGGNIQALLQFFGENPQTSVLFSDYVEGKSDRKPYTYKSKNSASTAAGGRSS